MNGEPPRNRAVKGTIGSQLPLRLTDEMRAAVDLAASAAGVSVAEWIRGAIARHLKRK